MALTVFYSVQVKILSFENYSNLYTDQNFNRHFEDRKNTNSLV